jgi:hypothetical protein
LDDSCISVSWHYVAKLPRGPRFAEKVLDVVGLYLDPPAGAVVLSFDEKTQVQALDRTQPLLPIEFGLTEKRTHDYEHNGTMNLFAALAVTTGLVTADCYPRRTGKAFLACINKAVKPTRPRSTPGWPATRTYPAPRTAGDGPPRRSRSPSWGRRPGSASTRQSGDPCLP